MPLVSGGGRVLHGPRVLQGLRFIGFRIYIYSILCIHLYMCIGCRVNKARALGCVCVYICRVRRR